MKKVEGFVDYKQEGWDNLFSGMGNSWRDKDYRFLEEVFDLSELSGSLLDVGCGLGDGQQLLYHECTKVTEFNACDFSSHAIEKCGLNENLKKTCFFTLDLMEDSFPRKYDMIICLQTLEHVHDPVRAFRKLFDAAEVLLIVSTPYKNNRPDENHLWSFDENDFSEFGGTTTIAQNGLNIFWLVDKTNERRTFRNNNILKLKKYFRKIMAIVGIST